MLTEYLLGVGIKTVVKTLSWGPGELGGLKDGGLVPTIDVWSLSAPVPSSRERELGIGDDDEEDTWFLSPFIMVFMWRESAVLIPGDFSE